MLGLSVGVLLFMAITFDSAVAQISCLFSSSLECRFLAACKKLPPEGSSASQMAAQCSCGWSNAENAFPASNLSIFVEFMEAQAPPRDVTRLKLLDAKIASNANEFATQLEVWGKAFPQCRKP